MDTKIIFIRHGKSEATDKFLAGRNPGVHLTDEGMIEANHVAESLKNVQIDKLFASPMERTLETAAPLAKLKNLEVESSKDIIEIEFGDWSGKTFDELRKDEVWKRFNTFRIGTRPPNGETIIEVQTRVVTFVEKIIKEYSGKTIAIVSHGDPIKTAIAYYIGLSPDLMSRIKIITGTASTIVINEWGCELIGLNSTLMD